MMVRRYSNIDPQWTFEERFEYLRLSGEVGRATFGFDRHLNQRFYTSREWRRIRDFVIVRDEGCDLGILGYEIFDAPIIHHMNPMGVGDIVRHEQGILDPDFLITVSHRTHNALHYGVDRLEPKIVLERVPNDTKLW